MARFSNKVAVVTGAAQGIGLAIALRLAQEGAAVAVLDLQDTATAAAACRAAGADCLARTVDVSSRDSIAAAVGEIAGRWGRLDIWVNNAGMFDNTPLGELAEERWDRIVAVNYKSMFLCSQLAAPYMLTRGWGRIINLASMAAKVAFAAETAYCSSKAAVLGLTRALAVELGPRGITANAICPGPIKTEMLRSTYQHLADLNGVTLAQWETEMLKGIPVGRFGQPADVAALVAFLASDEAGFINGQSINIDGGMVFY
jgi:NAD(P)-dependent dehydrogenase (short-subunit alcohol dehydrogenase family)